MKKRNVSMPKEQLRQHVPEIRRLLRLGVIQSKIAAMFDVNQGRINEIKNGKLFPEVA